MREVLNLSSYYFVVDVVTNITILLLLHFHLLLFLLCFLYLLISTDILKSERCFHIWYYFRVMPRVFWALWYLFFSCALKFLFENFSCVGLMCVNVCIWMCFLPLLPFTWLCVSILQLALPTMLDPDCGTRLYFGNMGLLCWENIKDLFPKPAG